MTIYDLRTSAEQKGFIDACNRWLNAWPGNPYLLEHGEVCSSRWWEHLGAGKLPISVKTGPVTHVGPTADQYNEPCDIIRFMAEDHDREYDREGFWLRSDIHVGDILTVTRTKITIDTPTGTQTWFIDVKMELERPQQPPVGQ